VSVVSDGEVLFTLLQQMVKALL